MILNNNEKIEDLEDKRLKIIQAKDSYRFSVDSILLLNFIRLKNYENIIDLGTGSGIIPLLLFGKKKGLSIYGVEIQKDLADMAPLRGNIAVNYEYMNNSMATLEVQASDKWSAIDEDNGEQVLRLRYLIN